jgi:predicted acyl esterase
MQEHHDPPPDRRQPSTFGSAGHIDFDLEAADGRAAADWIVEQPWSNGDLGTFGGSCLGFTQLALASTRPPQLKAMALAVWAAERRAYAHPGGAFSWAGSAGRSRSRTRSSRCRSSAPRRT